jgi:hypothetical protein
MLGSLVLAGCAKSAPSTHLSPPPSMTTTTLAPDTFTPVPAPSTAVTGERGEAVSAPLCRASGLRVGAGSAQEVAGNDGQTILFSNVGPSSCTVSGYPVVAALNAHGSQVAQTSARSPK